MPEEADVDSIQPTVVDVESSADLAVGVGDSAMGIPTYSDSIPVPKRRASWTDAVLLPPIRPFELRPSVLKARAYI